MIIILSPAKTLDFSKQTITKHESQIEFLEQAQTLANILKTYTATEIGDMMSISPKLSQLNFDRFQKWEHPFDPNMTKQALLAFKGDVYEGINAETFSPRDFEEAQIKLRILSGLYGILKPMDMILPYRLEMGTKLDNEKGTNLYTFWGDMLTENLNHDLMKNGNLLINLASNEYFKALKNKKLKADIVTPVFKDFKNGTYKMISFYAKKARGLMTRFIIQNRLTDAEDLKHFDLEGYSFNSKLTVKTNELVFTRG